MRVDFTYSMLSSPLVILVSHRRFFVIMIIVDIIVTFIIMIYISYRMSNSDLIKYISTNKGKSEDHRERLGTI